MSLQTTMARAKANACQRAWTYHRKQCQTCSGAVVARKWDGLCPEGASLWDDRGRVNRELDEEKRLDAEPAPGQGTIF